MKVEYVEAAWLEEQPELDIGDLAESSGLPIEVLSELVECGVLSPVASQPQWRFSGSCLATVRVASRLRNDFELDANALALVLRLLERVRDLEAELARVKAGWS